MSKTLNFDSDTQRLGISKMRIQLLNQNLKFQHQIWFVTSVIWYLNSILWAINFIFKTVIYDNKIIYNELDKCKSFLQCNFP